jgi:small subunit ribosomal protein S9
MATKLKTAEKAESASAKKATAFTGRYKQGVGGRKTATAQVRIFPKNSGIVVNGKDYTEYFKQQKHQMVVLAPLKTAQMEDAMGVSAHVMGGGIAGQADAIRNGIARALVEHDETLKQPLRRDGHMTRDPRAVERKKYGLKKARRAPQWAKR